MALSCREEGEKAWQPTQSWSVGSEQQQRVAPSAAPSVHQAVLHPPPGQGWGCAQGELGYYCPHVNHPTHLWKRLSRLSL